MKQGRFIFKMFPLLLWGILLTGCTFLHPTPPTSTPVASWEEREAKLRSITAWSLSGTMGFHNATEAKSANIQWQQAGLQRFSLQFFGPLGMGNTRIVGYPQDVMLIAPGKPPLHAQNGEALLKAQTGWDLPLEALYDWVKGVPAPGPMSHPQWDASSRLQQFEQQGWRISYKSYIPVQGFDLPNRITLSRPPLGATLLIRRWQLPN